MKNLWLIVIALALGACQRTGAPFQAQLDAGELISAAESVHDFGAVPEGDKLKHTFVLSNSGKQTLAIAVQSSCDCLRAELKKTEIPVGQSTELETTFDTIGRIGDQDKLITITPKDPSLAPTKLRIRAQIEPLLAFRRQATEHEEDIHLGETIRQEAWLVGVAATKANLAIERVTNPEVTAEVITKTDQEGAHKGVRITIPGKTIGHYHAAVVLRTGLEAKPQVTYTFDWSVLGNVQLTPQSLHYEPEGRGADERVIEVKSRLQGFELRSAKSSSPVFKVTIRPRENRGSFELRVRVVDQTALSRMEVANIEVVTNDEAQPRIDLPITVFKTILRNAASAASSTRPVP